MISRVFFKQTNGKQIKSFTVNSTQSFRSDFPTYICSKELDTALHLPVNKCFYFFSQ